MILETKYVAVFQVLSSSRAGASGSMKSTKFQFFTITIIIACAAFPAKKAASLEVKPIDLTHESQICGKGSGTFVSFWDEDSDIKHFVEARKLQEKYFRKEIGNEPLFIGDLSKNDAFLSRFRTDNIGSEVIVIPQDGRHSSFAVAYPDNRDIPSVLKSFVDTDRKERWKVIDIFCSEMVGSHEVLRHVRIPHTME